MSRDDHREHCGVRCTLEKIFPGYDEKARTSLYNYINKKKLLPPDLYEIEPLTTNTEKERIKDISTEAHTILSNALFLDNIFSPKTVEQVLKGEIHSDKLENKLNAIKKQMEIKFNAYANILEAWDGFKEILTKDKIDYSVDSIDTKLKKKKTKAGYVQRFKSPIPKSSNLSSTLYSLKCIEEIEGTIDYDDNNPDEIAKVAINYAKIGGGNVAKELLQKAIEQYPTHAILRYNSALIFLSESNKFSQEASHYKLLHDEATSLNEEQNWEQLMHDSVGSMQNSRDEALRNLIMAYVLWPHSSEYKNTKTYYSHVERSKALIHILDRVFEIFMSLDGRLDKKSYIFTEDYNQNLQKAIDETDYQLTPLKKENYFFSQMIDSIIVKIAKESWSSWTTHVYKEPFRQYTQLLHIFYRLSPEAYKQYLDKWYEEFNSLNRMNGDQVIAYLKEYVFPNEEPKETEKIMHEMFGTPPTPSQQRLNPNHDHFFSSTLFSDVVKLHLENILSWDEQEDLINKTRKDLIKRTTEECNDIIVQKKRREAIIRYADNKKEEALGLIKDALETTQKGCSEHIFDNYNNGRLRLLYMLLRISYDLSVESIHDKNYSKALEYLMFPYEYDPNYLMDLKDAEDRKFLINITVDHYEEYCDDFGYYNILFRPNEIHEPPPFLDPNNYDISAIEHKPVQHTEADLITVYRHLAKYKDHLNNHEKERLSVFGKYLISILSDNYEDII